MKAAGVRPVVGSRRLLRRPSPGARRTLALGGAIGLFTALAVLGDLLSPALRERHPLVLVLLAPRTAYLAAAAQDVPLLVFLVVAVVRLCAADPLHFMLGRTAGPAALATAGRFRLVRPVVERSRSCSNPLWLAVVAASPTAKTMVVSGAVGLRRRWVALADLVGTLARAVLIWSAGQRFPMMAETCAALAPWVAIPAAVAGVAVVGARWRQRLRSGPVPAQGELPCPVS